MSDTSRRKLLKSIAAGSGAIVAGKSLPESWSKPVVDSVVLPAHAQTSIAPPTEEPGSTGLYSQTQIIAHNFTDSGTLNVDFDVSGWAAPSTDGSLTLNLEGDFSFNTEYVDITVDGSNIGILFDGTTYTDCAQTGPESITIPQATLQAAAADGTVTISLIPGPGVDVCSGGAPDQSVQLEFTA